MIRTLREIPGVRWEWICVASCNHVELYARFKTLHNSQSTRHFKNGRLYTLEDASACTEWCIVSEHESRYQGVVAMSRGENIDDMCIYTHNEEEDTRFFFGIFSSTRQGRLVRLELCVLLESDDAKPHICTFGIPLQQRPGMNKEPRITIGATPTHPDGTIFMMDVGFWFFHVRTSSLDSQVDRGKCSLVVDGQLVNDDLHASHWISDGMGHIRVYLDQPVRWNGLAGSHHLSFFLTDGECPVRYAFEYQLCVMEAPPASPPF